MDTLAMWERIAELTGREEMPPMICSVCGRKLGTVFAISMHRVHPDMSLRCFAEQEPGERLGARGRAMLRQEDVLTLVEAAHYLRGSED